MNINIYCNKSDQRKVYKNIELIRENVSVQITEDCTIENPVLITQLNNLIPNANYIYIPDWNRYYFAELEIIEGNLCRISCQVDTLKSFFTSCGRSPVIARRSSSNFNIAIEDGRVVKNPKPTIIVRKMGAAFTPSSSNNFILTLAGREST